MTFALWGQPKRTTKFRTSYEIATRVHVGTFFKQSLARELDGSSWKFVQFGDNLNYVPNADGVLSVWIVHEFSHQTFFRRFYEKFLKNPTKWLHNRNIGSLFRIFVANFEISHILGSSTTQSGLTANTRRYIFEKIPELDEIYWVYFLIHLCSLFWSTHEPCIFEHFFFLKEVCYNFDPLLTWPKQANTWKNFKFSKTWVDQKTSPKWLNFHIKTFLSLKFLKISRKSYEMIA